MASAFITMAKPFSSLNTNRPLLSTNRPTSSDYSLARNNYLKFNAIAKKFEPTKKSAGGVLLPKAAVKFERYRTGEVVSVGADVGQVDSGKKVLFSDINAYEMDLGTEARHCFCKASDLLAVVE